MVKYGSLLPETTSLMWPLSFCRRGHIRGGGEYSTDKCAFLTQILLFNTFAIDPIKTLLGIVQPQ